MFSMTGIVLATNLIELFFFWEGVGLSSYLLIGFWFTRESAAAAANKAFVCNRLADFGFMIGILLLWWLTGSVSIRTADLQAEFLHVAPSTTYHALATATPNVEPAPKNPLIYNQGGVTEVSKYMALILVVGLFMGCMGKSAMFPFHVWLPDAMEGPTPVSALIHAATMVAAGVYMLCRVYPAAAALALGHVVHRLHRLLHRHLRRAHRRPAKRHQAHPCLLHALAARLHGHGRGLPRPRRRDVPPDHPRLLQGAALPRRRFRHPRAARGAGHLAHGRALARKSRSPSGPSCSACWR